MDYWVEEAVRRKRLLGLMGIVMISTMSVWAMPQDGAASVHVGPIRWTADSIDNFVVSDAGNVVLLGKKSDTMVIVADPMTGAERRRLYGYVGSTSLGCSPDGRYCLMAWAMTPEDPASTTLLYDVSDGRLLWKRNERVQFLAMSTGLNRVMVQYTYSDVHGSELRDLQTGEVVKRYDSYAGYAFMDEWHRRIYLSTGKWDGISGSWIIELDALTGQELNRWELDTYGPICRLRNSDTLLVVGWDHQHPLQSVATVIALDVALGHQNPILSCPMIFSSDSCSCIDATGLGHWRVTADGREAMLQEVHGRLDRSLIARRFVEGQLMSSECYVNEPITWPDNLLPIFREIIDGTNESLYYLPDGSALRFHVRALGPVLSVPEYGQPGILMLVVDGSALHIHSPVTGADEATISVTDMSGRIVKRIAMRLNGQHTTVSVADLPSGSYLCSMESGMVTSTGRFLLVR